MRLIFATTLTEPVYFVEMQRVKIMTNEPHHHKRSRDEAICFIIWLIILYIIEWCQTLGKLWVSISTCCQFITLLIALIACLIRCCGKTMGQINIRSHFENSVKIIVKFNFIICSSNAKYMLLKFLRTIRGREEVVFKQGTTVQAKNFVNFLCNLILFQQDVFLRFSFFEMEKYKEA